VSRKMCRLFKPALVFSEGAAIEKYSAHKHGAC
jgi:hypothetical protein